MPTGTVKWFNSQKGYGFIQPKGGGQVPRPLRITRAAIQLNPAKRRVAFCQAAGPPFCLTTAPLSGGVSRHYPLSTTAQIAVIDPSSIDCWARLLIDPVVPKRAAAPDDQHGVAGLDRASAIGARFPGHIRGGNTPWEQT